MAKRMSRAARLNAAYEEITSKISELRGIEESKVLTEEQKVDEANLVINSIDLSEIESLRDEITEWKDNIEANFSATQKFSDLEECASDLEGMHSDLESAISEVTNSEDISSVIDNLESGVDLGCSISFPGMY